MTSPYDSDDPWDSSPAGGASTSTDLALPSDYDTGLDDLGSDFAVPRLKIAHKRGVFVDPSDNQEYSTIFCVILGLVKQRVLFDAKVDPNNPEKPMCKSPDATVGFPNLNPENPKKAFPWDKAKLDLTVANRDDKGRVFVGCKSCYLKEWDSHPLGDKPWCSEQFTLPILFAASLEQLRAGEGSPALISMQKTSIKSTKKYLQTFQIKKVGAYTAYTKLDLQVERVGDNVFSKPIYSRVGDTERGAWLDFVEQFQAISSFLKEQRPAAPDDGSEETNGREVLDSTVSTGGRPPMGQPAAAVATPAQPPVAPVHDNGLPF